MIDAPQFRDQVDQREQEAANAEWRERQATELHLIVDEDGHYD